VGEERLISEEAEWRDFGDEPGESKSRVGEAHNPLLIVDLTTRSQLTRDEREFLWEGFRNIKRLLDLIYVDERVPPSLLFRAKKLFQDAFLKQQEQMRGEHGLHRNGKVRRRFSKRKQFVITFTLQALKEERQRGWDLDKLNALMGWHVSSASIKKCLKENVDLR